MNTTQITAGSLVKIAGVNAPVLVVEVLEGGFYAVSGPRGDFAIVNCGTHWLRGAMRRAAAPREIIIEWTKAPVAA